MERRSVVGIVAWSLLCALAQPSAAQGTLPPEQLRELKDLKRDGNAAWKDGEQTYELSVTGAKAIVDNANAVVAMMPIEAKFTPPMMPPDATQQMRADMERQAKASNDMFTQMLQDVFRDKFMKLGYQVVDRQETEKVLQEQNLNMTDLVAQDKKIRVGKLLSARFLYLQQVHSVTLMDYRTRALSIQITYTGRFTDVETGRVCASVQYVITQQGLVQ